MSDPSTSTEQNILPVQALFDAQNNFQTFIGQGQPFYASVDPAQSGLNITNSTINSTTIGATTPSSAAFVTATVSTAPVGTTDVVNKQYLEYFAAGLSWKQPVLCATTANITLSGVQTLDGISAVAGSRVLVKNQTAAEENGIYISAAGAWARSEDANTWDDLVSAMLFVEEGSTLAGKAFYCTAQQGGTLGTTAVNWSNFSVAASYTAGTGLTLAASQFSITNTGVTAATYGSASSVPVVAVNAQGQITSATNTAIAIANTAVSGLGTMSTQNANNVAISGGAINGTTVGATTAAAVTGTTITATSDFSGPGTNLSGTASALSIGGNAATATTATTATNIAGGSAGSVPYQSASNTTTLLAAGSNGQVLTLASGVPSWATPTTGTVTSVGGTGTVSGISLSGTVTSSGNLTLGGSLDLSSPPAIGGTARNTAAFTTELVGPAASANFTRFPNALAVVSNTDAGIQQNETEYIGLIAEATANSATPSARAAGLYGVGYSQGGASGEGVNGEGHVSSSADTGNAVGVRGYANDTHSGGLNIGLYGNASGSSVGNYALYLKNGDALSFGAMNWVLGGNLTFTGAYKVTTPALDVIGAIGVGSSPSYGTSGQVLTSAGTGAAPTWTTPASYATVTDDTTTNATRYILFANQTTGNLSTEYVSSTKLKYNPSTGALTASQLIIAP